MLEVINKDKRIKCIEDFSWSIKTIEGEEKEIMPCTLKIKWIFSYCSV